jgi:hypothetical protein
LTLALEELRELARGLHPAILADRGLGPALGALAERSLLPVELQLDIDERLPDSVEVAVFSIVSESFTNVAKYANATSARVHVGREDALWSWRSPTTASAKPTQKRLRASRAGRPASPRSTAVLRSRALPASGPRCGRAALAKDSAGRELLPQNESDFLGEAPWLGGTANTPGPWPSRTACGQGVKRTTNVRDSLEPDPSLNRDSPGVVRELIEAEQQDAPAVDRRAVMFFRRAEPELVNWARRQAAALLDSAPTGSHGDLVGSTQMFRREW